jgi:hypothetical protein
MPALETPGMKIRRGTAEMAALLILKYGIMRGRPPVRAFSACPRGILLFRARD